MNWVDVTKDHRWSLVDLQRRAANELAVRFPDSDSLKLRASAVAVGGGFLGPSDRPRMEAYLQAAGELEGQVAAEWAVMQRLDLAMAVEAAQRALRALPDDEDHAALRADQQAVINAASSEVLELVAARNRVPPVEGTPA